jgi:hypothetical protein
MSRKAVENDHVKDIMEQVGYWARLKIKQL